MTEPYRSLALCYKGWDGYQEHLVRASASLTPEQLGLHAAPYLRSLGEQLAHIVAVRARWLRLDLHEGGAELDALMSWDGWTLDDGQKIPPDRSAAELVGGLETTWHVIQPALQRWTIADLAEVFLPSFPGEESFTRQFVIWHLIEHDLHHGGELSFLLGMHGLTAIPI
jgi:uncharacterized damage-inducible protein DinB